MDLMLKDKIAVVTGCRGICKEIALTLAEEGVHLAITYVTDKGKKSAEDSIGKILAMGRKAIAVKMDLLNKDHSIRKIWRTQRYCKLSCLFKF